MKKILLLILSLSLLIGCSSFSNSSNPKDSDVMEGIRITEIEWCGIEWDQIQFPFELSEEILKEIRPMESNQAAVEGAKSIIEKLHREGILLDYTLISITHSTEDNIWRFEYSIDQRNEDVDKLIDCGGLYVAIDGNKGALIKAWVEE